MTISDNISTLHGFDVVDFESDQPPADPTRTAVRLRVEYDGEFEEFADLWAKFMSSPGVEETQALVIGNWANPDESGTSSEQAVALIVSDAERLPKLRALFFGDITSEENEISWIQQSDVSAFWGAFLNLEVFGVRGGNGLQLGAIRHARLKALTVEAGGLPRTGGRGIGDAHPPGAEHPPIWFGPPGSRGRSQARRPPPLLRRQPVP